MPTSRAGSIRPVTSTTSTAPPGRGARAQPTRTALVEEEVFGPSGAAALYRRDWLVRLGGFDESYFCYFEDVDLNLRLQVAGGRCLYVPAARVRHVGGASSGGLSAFTIYHSQRNLVWTFVKSMPPHLFWRYLPMHVLLNVGSIVSYGVRGHTKTAAAGEAGRSARASGDGARAPVGDGIARVRSGSRSTPHAAWRCARSSRDALLDLTASPATPSAADQRVDLVARDEAEGEDEAGEDRDRHDRADDLADLRARAAPAPSATPPLRHDPDDGAE